MFVKIKQCNVFSGVATGVARTSSGVAIATPTSPLAPPLVSNLLNGQFSLAAFTVLTHHSAKKRKEKEN